MFCFFVILALSYNSREEILKYLLYFIHKGGSMVYFHSFCSCSVPYNCAYNYNNVPCHFGHGLGQLGAKARSLHTCSFAAMPMREAVPEFSY